MKIMERCTQKVVGKSEDAIALEKKYDELEAKMGGVPSKRRYWAGPSGLPAGTMVWERDWPSIAAWEAYMEKTFSDPEWAALSATGVYADGQFEIFAPW
jgi:hypothetical protein